VVSSFMAESGDPLADDGPGDEGAAEKDDPAAEPAAAADNIGADDPEAPAEGQPLAGADDPEAPAEGQPLAEPAAADNTGADPEAPAEGEPSALVKDPVPADDAPADEGAAENDNPAAEPAAVAEKTGADTEAPAEGELPALVKDEKKHKKDKKEKKAKKQALPTSSKELKKVASKFEEGEIVLIWGLSSEEGKLLNGQRGQIMKFLKDKARFEVRLVWQPDRTVNIRPDNLTSVDDAPVKKRPVEKETPATKAPIDEAPSKRAKEKEDRMKGTGPTTGSSSGQVASRDREPHYQDFWGDDHNAADAYGASSAAYGASPADKRIPTLKVATPEPAQTTLPPKADDLEARVDRSITELLKSAKPAAPSWQSGDDWSSWHGSQNWKDWRAEARWDEQAQESWNENEDPSTRALAIKVEEDEDGEKADIKDGVIERVEIERVLRLGPSSRWLAFCQEHGADPAKRLEDHDPQFLSDFLSASQAGNIPKWAGLRTSRPEVPRASLAKPQIQLPAISGTQSWNRKGFMSLVKSLLAVRAIKTEELPSGATISAACVRQMRQRLVRTVERPVQVFNEESCFPSGKEIFVGCTSGEQIDRCRGSCDFVVTSHTWRDVDEEMRDVPHYLQEQGCAFQPQELYGRISSCAASGVQLIVKVSCVATEVEKLNSPATWWPKLWAKYSGLSQHTVAYLWYLPSSLPRSPQNVARLTRLIEYLDGDESPSPEARHIVAFHHSSWYTAETYKLLRSNHWCYAWLNVNEQSADRFDRGMPTGWTDRVVTTDMCYIELGSSQAAEVIEDIYETCEGSGVRNYVAVCEESQEMALMDSAILRSCIARMELTERLQLLGTRGDCPRELDPAARFLVNYFFLRFSTRARAEGVRLSSPVCIAPGDRYEKNAPEGKRIFEWLLLPAQRRLHIALSRARDTEDLWLHLRQLSGLEDLTAATEWVQEHKSDGDAPMEDFHEQEATLVTASFLRFSSRARRSGLHTAMKLSEVDVDGNVHWSCPGKPSITLSPADMSLEDDLWIAFIRLSGVLAANVSTSADSLNPLERLMPWKDGTSSAKVGEMWQRAKPNSTADAVDVDKWWEQTHEEQDEAQGSSWKTETEKDRWWDKPAEDSKTWQESTKSKDWGKKDDWSQNQWSWNSKARWGTSW